MFSIFDSFSLSFLLSSNSSLKIPEVKVISARGDYEKYFPGDMRQWKIQAFLEVNKNLDKDVMANIICIGDSMYEIEAAHVMASHFREAFVKTVKFREAPKPQELVKQLSLIYDQINSIFSSVKNLTIRVEKKHSGGSKCQTNNGSFKSTSAVSVRK